MYKYSTTKADINNQNKISLHHNDVIKTQLYHCFDSMYSLGYYHFLNLIPLSPPHLSQPHTLTQTIIIFNSYDYPCSMVW